MSMIAVMGPLRAEVPCAIGQVKRRVKLNIHSEAESREVVNQQGAMRGRSPPYSWCIGRQQV